MVITIWCIFWYHNLMIFLLFIYIYNITSDWLKIYIYLYVRYVCISYIHKLYIYIDFTCAVESTVLLHGRMYITSKFICFYSNLFGLEKKIRIPYSHIRSITKTMTAMVIPNAISISTGQYVLYHHQHHHHQQQQLLLLLCIHTYCLDECSDRSSKL